MPFSIVRQDICEMHVDVIVNAANTDLVMGGGVCGAIFTAAGPDELQEACDKLAPIKTGQAVITPGFNLPAQYVIHAAGPVYNHNNPQQSEELLRAAYSNSLLLAIQNECESIAFPLISSGLYGYPKQEALTVATAAIKDFLADYEMDIYLVVFDEASFSTSEKLLGEVESYIDEYYVATHRPGRRGLLEVEVKALCEVDAISFDGAAPFEIDDADDEELVFDKVSSIELPMMAKASLDDYIGFLDEPFNTTLMRLIDAKGKTDVEVYKRANIDRKLFSKIRTGKGYLPSKRTALALAIALELDLEETDDLLERAGYALSHSQLFDVIVEYFIKSARYDIFEINEVLFKYGQPCLGAS